MVNVYMSVITVMGPSVICATSVPLVVIHISNSHCITDLFHPVLPTGAAKAMPCFIMPAITHVKDPQLYIGTVGYHVPLTGFCLSLYNLHVLNRDVKII